MARVFWDTSLFVYLFEKNAEWSPRVIDFRRRMVARRDELLTSYLTVGEVITKPRQLGNITLEKSYVKFFPASRYNWCPLVWMLPSDMETSAAANEFDRQTPSNSLVLRQPGRTCS